MFITTNLKTFLKNYLHIFKHDIPHYLKNRMTVYINIPSFYCTNSYFFHIKLIFFLNLIA